MKQAIILFSLLLAFSIQAQEATKAKDRFDGYEQRQRLISNSLVKNLEFKNIGPTVMSGRVTDIAVNPENSTHFFVAYASGGLWETKNNGTTFSPLFDQEIVMTIGDIDVDWKKEIIYLGSGENNSSRSSYSGYGIFKGENFGEKWTHIGLEETHHIGRIIVHPSDPNQLFVAALGKLYSADKHRGIYTSKDQGKTWDKVLFVNENCGGIDLVINKENPEVLYASMWERTRRAWDFTESGNGSGIYRSSNGGSDWTRLNTKESGFPSSPGIGRIGLDIYSQGQEEILYAFLDNQERRDKEEEDGKDGLEKDDFKSMSNADLLLLDDDELNDYLSSNGFPEKYRAKEVKKLVKKKKVQANDLASYLEDANRMLFDTPVKGAELYSSKDGGKTWKKTHEKYLDDVVYSYGYYFGLVRVDPNNADRVYIAGVPILTSEDGGENFHSINGDNVHVDHHALWINPKKAGHIINGNDGGINISYDYGENWIKSNSPAVGQFYTVQIDLEEPYNVYGGFQDNGVWYAPNTYEWSDRWHQTGDYPYKSIMGGDGMQIMVDDRDPNIVYTGYQFGNYYRINKATGAQSYVTPKHDLGENPFRWNWQSPIWLSKHNQDILYMGSNRFHRSMDQGETWETLSGELTQGGKKGDVPYGTLSSIHESPLQFGLLYAGSDDGKVHVSKNGGNSWEDISAQLPKYMWVSRVKASFHKKERVYLSLNGYRWDHFEPMLYVSNDFGNTWTNLSKGLPKEPINVVYEDPENEQLIYVGTDHGIYCSIDGGKNYMAMSKDIPAVAVHDIAVHPIAKDLIIATHGRSFYKADISGLQILGDSILASDFYVYDLESVNYRSNWGESWSKWLEPNIPEFSFAIWSSSALPIQMKVSYGDIELFEREYQSEKGLNYLNYDLSIANNIDSYRDILKEDNEDIKVEEAKNGKTYLRPGEYVFELRSGKETLVKKLIVTDL